MSSSIVSSVEAKSLRQPLKNDRSSLEPVSDARLQAGLKRLSEQNLKNEYQIKEFETKLTENLNNFKTIDNLLRDAYKKVRDNEKRADRVHNVHRPYIETTLSEAYDILAETDDRLPTIQAQLTDIRSLYESGRRKAQDLVKDLTWLNTEFYERWRATIFSSSPVSRRWTVLMRVVFIVSFVICSRLAYLALMGGYRAYRHKLVWGDKLMS